jgi:hypothetical protein
MMQPNEPEDDAHRDAKHLLERLHLHD